VLLLEKVWAKINGSYHSIISGNAKEALHYLTGAPTLTILTNPDHNKSDILWKKIKNASSLGYV
jgi:hypothetical protein